MITSSLIRDPMVCICHKVADTPTVEEIALAIQHTLQHSELPVIWDLHELDLDADLAVLEANLRALVDRWRSRMSVEKRAFVVPRDARDRFAQFLGSLRLPWTWAVFETEAAAVRWLQIEA